ncbi:MAG: bifunctional 5,10-methylenetetrahydrofolate dehydrogenase/5,10-methenyltetrahydrofolate cyclohydrolase [Desulfotomaculum sp.]|nr:bifunctional 5,10-methylenetetrahydrofolate dehydrogenase/5,10-methenyltetrahydrofolate cyclohydrolase [Desulfotomaculum sp.]
MAKILDGKKIAGEIKEEIKLEVNKWKSRGVIPCLSVLLVGDDAASIAYAKFLEKVASSVGVKFHLEQLNSEVSEDDVLSTIDKLNHNKEIHGILLLLPLPKHIDKQRVMDSVLPAKDVDGVHPINRGYILSNGQCIYPATPLSCLEILKRSGIELAGKHAVIVGRGETVGKPLLYMALSQNATVTVCHTRTPDLSYHTRQADVLFTAVGKPGLITRDMVKEGAVVVDAGISEVDGKICGDVDFDAVKEAAGAITPVPGGVGSLTTVLMLKNLLKGISMQESLVNIKVNN